MAAPRHLFVARVLGLADGRPCDEVAGRYIRAYDPEAEDGRGKVTVTGHPGAALTGTAEQWIERLQATPACRPTRPDGRPNRPLSAFHVELIGVAEVVTPPRPGGS